ncbi:MAG: metallophosphoesterase family protein [Opitutae bacterium]|nr:metallophosphoesterase family protein [Opitutae bacterium]
MRIAVLADIHGNLAALEAALAEVARLQPDRVVVAGDVVDGCPDSLACWERVRALGCPLLRGNHERYIFDYGTPRAAEEWSLPHFAPVRWAVAQCTEVVRREMAALPIGLRLPEAPGVLFVHASARSDQDSVFAHTPDAVLAPMFPDVNESVIVRGHNHLAGTRAWGDRQIMNLGAVGLPLDGHIAAQFGLLEQRQGAWQLQHIAVPYDVEATIRRFRESGYLEAGGPMARLFLREVATATHHFVPFLRHYGHAVRSGHLAADVAVARFLSEY